MAIGNSSPWRTGSFCIQHVFITLNKTVNIRHFSRTGYLDVSNAVTETEWMEIMTRWIDIHMESIRYVVYRYFQSCQSGAAVKCSEPDVGIV